MALFTLAALHPTFVSANTLTESCAYSLFYVACALINEMLIDNSLHDNIEFLKRTHTDRLYNGLWAPIQQHLLPLGCSVEIRPRGGYFIWVKIPITTTLLTETIKKHNIQVGVGQGPLFVVTKGPSFADYYIRLSFAHYNTQTLQQGVARLKEALTLALNESSPFSAALHNVSS